MARFQVLVTDSGRTLVTSTADIPQHEAEAVLQLFQQWRETEESILIMMDAEVMRVKEIDLDVSRETSPNLGLAKGV